jgi:hypothetical protein
MSEPTEENSWPSLQRLSLRCCFLVSRNPRVRQGHNSHTLQWNSLGVPRRPEKATRCLSTEPGLSFWIVQMSRLTENVNPSDRIIRISDASVPIDLELFSQAHNSSIKSAPQAMDYRGAASTRGEKGSEKIRTLNVRTMVARMVHGMTGWSAC